MRDKKILLFGIHMHQPVDNLSEAVDRAVNECYAPFFKILKEYEGFKFAVHCSGWLLEKIATDYPSLFDDIKAISDRGDIEWLSAGYYEPILSSIPAKDRVAQIKMLNKTLKKLFGYRARGIWLTERVWDSSIIEALDRTDIKYTLVDDYHFISAGFDRDRLNGYYLTEEGGKRVALFPISQRLRYAIPFIPAKKAIETIKDVAGSDGVATIFDDAEKFGMWPKTHEWVYGKGWLREWLDALQADDEIVTMHYSRYLKEYLPKGLAYLPNVSYFEMGEWSLETQNALKLEELKEMMGEELFEKEGIKFLKGGIWKNFFIKYPESNRIHKRMLEISKDRDKNKKIKKPLFKLQTNDLLWHGVFGGIYLPNLRDNAYRYLAECENIRYKKGDHIEVADIDMDGIEELKIIKKHYIARFERANGAQLTELISRDSLFNFQNTLTRREEAYHRKITQPQATKEPKEPQEGISTIHNDDREILQEIRDALYFDWYQKNSFIDHISNDTLNAEGIKRCNFWEYGDFANQPYRMEIEDDTIIFKREGGIYYDESWDTSITKCLIPKDDSIEFEIEIDTSSPHKYRYGLEFNLHFADYSDITINSNRFDELFEAECINQVVLSDSYTSKNIIIETTTPFNVVIVPLDTVSQSEDGFELTRQAITVMLIFTLQNSLIISGKLEISNV